MSVIASPAASSSVSIVGTEAGVAVVTISSRLVVGLVGSCLVPAKATQAAVLRVQVGVTTEALLGLLTLQRGKTSLALGLARGVGSGTRPVSLG